MISPELTYLLKVNLALILFYAFYRLFCTRDTFFRWRRFTQLAFWLIAWIYPLMNLQNWISEQAPMQEAVSYTQNIYAEAFTVAPGSPSTTFSVFSTEMLLLIYLAGVAILGARFLIQLGIIYRLSRQSRKIRVNGTPVRLLKKDSGPFSFFRWIFIHPGTLENSLETEEILAHELTHVREWHSVDVLLSELNCIICWMNPFSWLLKREVRNNLEYLADHHVVATGHDTKTYQYHLLGLTHHKAAATLYNHFNVLPIKKRITMMNKKRTKEIGRTKYLLFLPLAAMLMILSNIEAVARSTQHAYSKITETLSTAITEEAPTSVNQEITPTDTETTKKAPLILIDGKIYSKKITFDVNKATNEEWIEFLGIKPEYIESMTVLKDKAATQEYGEKGKNGVILLVTKKDKPSLNTDDGLHIPATDRMNTQPASISDSPSDRMDHNQANAVTDSPSSKEAKDEKTEKPESIPEKAPEFKGGKEAMYEFLAKNMVYPKKAQEEGIQGNVFIRFAIEKDGSMSNVEVVRSLSPETDEEAVRVIKSMPKWEPGTTNGKPVRAYFVIPIRFGL